MVTELETHRISSIVVRSRLREHCCYIWSAGSRESAKAPELFRSGAFGWLLGLDLNQRPLGYEPIATHHGLQRATTPAKRKHEVSAIDLGSGCRALEVLLR